MIYRDFTYAAVFIQPTGATLAFCNDFVSLYYQSTVNAAGMAVITVPSTHALIPLLQDDLMVEIKFGYPNATNGNTYTYFVDFTGLYKDVQIATDRAGNKYYILYFVGAAEALARPIIAYAADTNDMTRFVDIAADVIMKTIADYNCGASAVTASGRVRSVNRVWKFVGPALLGGQDTLSYSCAYGNVLEALKELARLARIDFAVARDPSATDTLKMTLYAGQMGTDRSTTIIFDLNLHNLGRASLNADRLREKTVAIVGGPGDGAARSIAIRTGANYTATNDYEIFVDARSNTAAELNDAGDAKLAELRSLSKIDGEIIQSQGYMYGRDYRLGDKVSVRFSGVTAVKKIVGVDVKFAEDSSTDISMRFEDL